MQPVLRMETAHRYAVEYMKKRDFPRQLNTVNSVAAQAAKYVYFAVCEMAFSYVIYTYF